MRIYSRILGTGSYLPEKRLTNADLAAKIAAGGTMVAPVRAATWARAASLTSVMTSLAPAACSLSARWPPTCPTP